MEKKFFSFITQVITFTIVAYAGVNVVSYLFFSKKPASVACQAPESVVVLRPLATKAAFLDGESSRREKTMQLKTNWGTLIFSSHGGTLQRFEVNRPLQGKDGAITTVFPMPAEQQMDRCFLTVLDRETPYYYQLSDTVENDSVYEVEFTAKTKTEMIKKRFTIFKDSYKINLSLSINNYHDSMPLRVRTIFSAPEMVEIQNKDVIAGFVSEGGAVKRFAESVAPVDLYWPQENLFGLSNRYFIHACIGSSSNENDERNYFMRSEKGRLMCCMESSEIEKKQELNWEFYFGPKDINDIRPVAARLEELVDYSGWLAPVSVFMLSVLKFFNNYLGNFGWAIILLTILMRLLMLPFSPDPAKGKEQKKESERQLRYIEKKYKNDPERLNKEKLAILKNQLSGGSFLIGLLNFPIFMALNRLLASSIELYQAPFIKGWIVDLSAPDPYYILPALFGVGLLCYGFQQAEASQRIMFMGMAALAMAFFSSFSAGLLLFFVTNILVQLLITVVTKKFNRA